MGVENVSLGVFDRREEQRNNFDRYPCTIYLSINQLRLVFFLFLSLLRSDSVASQPIDDGRNPDRKRSLEGLSRISLALRPPISEFSCAMRMDGWRHDGFFPPVRLVRNLCRHLWKSECDCTPSLCLNCIFHWKIFYPDSDFLKKVLGIGNALYTSRFLISACIISIRETAWRAIDVTVDGTRPTRAKKL